MNEVETITVLVIILTVIAVVIACSRRSCFKKRVASTCHYLVNLEREVFFGDEDEDRWMPEFQQSYSRTMCPPFMGKNYQGNGLLFLGINPGGGKARGDLLVQGDKLLDKPLRSFKTTKSKMQEIYWGDFVPAFVEAMQTFPIYRKDIEENLEAAQLSLDDVCYLNVLQYRCREDAYPKNNTDRTTIVDSSINKFLKPFLELAKPSMVVCLGVWVEDQLNEFWGDFPYETVVWDREQANTARRRERRQICLSKIQQKFVHSP